MRRERPLVLGAYAGLASALSPLLPRFLARRARLGKEDPTRIDERLGRPQRPRPDGRLVWLHAASVGEITTVLPLVERLVADGAAVLVTTVTVSSARLAAERLPAGAIHQFVPLDLPEAAARFLDHWRPDLVLFAEQELWPNLIEAAAARGLPMALVNARMSPRSAAGWSRWAGGLVRHLLGRFAVVLAQSEDDAARLRRLGARRVIAPGNLKLDVPAPAVDAAALDALLAALGGRPAWLAASTHDGDEPLVIAAQARARERVPDLVLMVAPRHPPRADEVERLLVEAGLRVARRSRGEWPTAAHESFLLDTIGEMGLVYRAARVVLVGKSFLPPGGGQNPIEPARLARPVLHGPLMFNFAEVTDVLDASGGGLLIEEPASIGPALAELIAGRDAAEIAGERAKAAVEGLAGGLDRTLAELAPLLAGERT
jgi:3-deoxy-D-manno-octulosonic-acid transferase